MTTRNRELASIIDDSGNITAGGNLTVSGTTLTASSTVETHADPLIELNTGAGSNSNDLGFVFERGSTGDNACILWDESNDGFAVGTTTATGTSTGNMSFTTADFAAGKVTVDNVLINGTTIGHTSDTDLITLADGVVTVAGEISVTTLDIGGTNVSSTAAELNILDGVNSTAAELNILDGVTATAAEINIIDGDTSATGTTLADADRVIVNDGGTMKQVALTDFETYFESSIDTFSTIDINGGSIDGATVGTNSAAAGAFTTLSASGAITGTLGTAAQTNITSLGTLTALTGGTGDLIWDTPTFVVDSSADKVGMGTTTPDGKLHIMSASAGTVDAHASADELVVEGSGNSGINILSANNGEGGIYFGDDGDNDIGRIRYDHTNNSLDFFVNASERMSISSAGAVSMGGDLAVTGTSTFAHGVFDAGNATIQLKNGNDNYYVWRNLDSTNDLDLRYNSTQLFAYDQSTTKWDWRGAHTVLESALTDGSTAVNAGTTNNFTLVLQENTTIGAPSNASSGQVIVFEISQHASTGPYTLAWNSVFEFAASTAPTMTATDNKCDIFTFRYNGSKWQEIGRVQNMAVS